MKIEEKTAFAYYYLINKYRVCRKKAKLIFHIKASFPKKFARKETLSQKSFNYEVADRILSGKPFMVARYGSVEISNIIQYLSISLGLKNHMRDDYLKHLNKNAGFFPLGEENAKRFCEYMLEYIKDVDMLGLWFRNMEDYLLKYYHAKDVKITRLRHLEPYYDENPWTKALKGKKVLVIHPFEQSIQNQYNKRELLFKNPDVLPEFELLTLKAIQSNAYNETKFSNWFEALDYMYGEAMKMDFDVAILGCGAYGFPLAARLKRAGKQAVHMGGTVQILFGIKGKRWDNDPGGSSFYNEHWVRPLPEETPEKASSVENACYW